MSGSCQRVQRGARCESSDCGGPEDQCLGCGHRSSGPLSARSSPGHSDAVRPSPVRGVMSLSPCLPRCRALLGSWLRRPRTASAYCSRYLHCASPPRLASPRPPGVRAVPAFAGKGECCRRADWRPAPPRPAPPRPFDALVPRVAFRPVASVQRSRAVSLFCLSQQSRLFLRFHFFGRVPAGSRRVARKILAVAPCVVASARILRGMARLQRRQSRRPAVAWRCLPRRRRRAAGRDV